MIAVLHLRVAFEPEGRPDDRRLEVVGHQRSGSPFEPIEGPNMEVDPRGDRLVEDHAGIHVAAEPKDHDEDPGLSGQPGRGVNHEPDAAEVNLSDLARRRLDADGDVGGHGARAGRQVAAHA